jgi:hypothetical protein
MFSVEISSASSASSPSSTSSPSLYHDDVWRTPSPRPRTSSLTYPVGSAACFAVLMLPVIIAEFYFGLNAISCQKDNFFLTLSQWLITDASYQLGCTVVIMALLLVGETDAISILVPCVTFLSLVWTVVGAVLFWEFLLPDGRCRDDVSTLMWIRLIAGFLNVLKRVS